MEYKFEELEEKSQKHSVHDATSYVSSLTEEYKSEGEWRDIIFLPFRRKWQIMITIFVLINTVICLYQIMFGSLGSYALTLEYIHDFTYIIDTTLVVFHRYVIKCAKF